MVGDCCLIIIILLLPPLGVFIMRGCHIDFWINVILTVCGYIPGHLHAFYVLIKEREARRTVVINQEGPPMQPGGYGAIPQ